MPDHAARLPLLQQIETERQSRAILYVTGSRPGMETQIGQDVIDLFVDHLDEMGPVPKISLILETNGGQTSAAWNLVNLIKMFGDELELIVPANCRSAGTLIALGASPVVMTKQATLGPIDPSLQHPLGPPIPGMGPDSRTAVSVEAVTGYLDALRETSAGGLEMAEAIQDLATYVHPLVLGEIFRSREQIRNLAERLLAPQGLPSHSIRRVVDFLCSESGSHDYTINRREAAELGLQIEKCSPSLYSILHQLRRDYVIEMGLREPFDPGSLVDVSGASADYSIPRAIVESSTHPAYHFLSEGTVVLEDMIDPDDGSAIPVRQAHDMRHFEGWRILS